MSQAGFEALRARVWDDPVFAAALAGLPAERFADELVRRARLLGINVEPADVAAALNAGRADWLMRWIR
jgi:hypothetical protein